MRPALAKTFRGEQKDLWRPKAPGGCEGRQCKMRQAIDSAAESGAAIFDRMAVLLCSLAALTSSRVTAQPQSYIQFDGRAGNYVEIDYPDAPDFSVNRNVGLTVSAWMRPDDLHFDRTDGSDPNQQFVHWLGKGVGSDDNAQQEWTFRIYSQNLPLPCKTCPRINRVSFYVFNLARPAGKSCQNEGIGSYFQYPINDPDPLVAGEWIHIAGVVDDSPDVKTT